MKMKCATPMKHNQGTNAYSIKIKKNLNKSDKSGSKKIIKNLRSKKSNKHIYHILTNKKTLLNY
jgi:hypothetical protein